MGKGIIMNTDQFTSLIKGVRAAYPNFKFIESKEGFVMWYELLKDIPYETLSMAFQKHISTSKYPPSVAEIRSHALEPVKTKDWSSGWGLIKKSISRFGQKQAKEAITWISEKDEIAAIVISRMGFETFCNSKVDEESTFRAQFRMAYENIEFQQKEYGVLPTGLKRSLEELDNKNRADNTIGRLADQLSLKGD